MLFRSLLTLRSAPTKPTPIEKAGVDWTKTIAWGDGGYYGRLFLNVQGREPQGQIPAADYERVRDDLIARIEGLTYPDGVSLHARAYRPETLYREVKGVPPDLIVYFGDLAWRSVGSVGMGGIYTFDNDTGPDEANHDWHGIFIHADPRRPGEGRRDGLAIEQVAPTILARYDLAPTAGAIGSAVDFRSDRVATAGD